MLHTYIQNYYICVHHHVTHIYKLLLLNLCSPCYTRMYTTITTFLCSPPCHTQIYTTITTSVFMLHTYIHYYYYISVFTTMLHTYIHYYHYICVHHITHIYTLPLHLCSPPCYTHMYTTITISLFTTMLHTHIYNISKSDYTEYPPPFRIMFIKEFFIFLKIFQK